MLASRQEGVMALFRLTRRQFVQAGGAGILALWGCDRQEQAMVTLYTFGDSILDCGRYNEFGVHPGQLLVHNNDRLFPEFRGQDLASRTSARLEHRARDGATVDGLPSQAQGLQVTEQAIAIITIGGNDLLQGLIQDTGAGIATFAKALDTFVQQLPIRPILLGSVYDPTLGDDNRNFVGIDPAIARKNLQRMNTAIQEIASRYGQFC
jgi:acyl-CoA thioesterase-1